MGSRCLWRRGGRRDRGLSALGRAWRAGQSGAGRGARVWAERGELPGLSAGGKGGGVGLGPGEGRWAGESLGPWGREEKEVAGWAASGFGLDAGFGFSSFLLLFYFYF